MIMAKDIFQRVADEARPPAVLGRYPGMPDYFTEVLLDDLVESGAWLDLELKRPFLALWVNDEVKTNDGILPIRILEVLIIDPQR